MRKSLRHLLELIKCKGAFEVAIGVYNCIGDGRDGDRLSFLFMRGRDIFRRQSFKIAVEKDRRRSEELSFLTDFKHMVGAM
ncbi:hypothetical protein IA69_13015 [Massilia sp. JS1662]|nr:hypothetical protein IA69_13015 [Massilia sp. JS1662]